MNARSTLDWTCVAVTVAPEIARLFESTIRPEIVTSSRSWPSAEREARRKRVVKDTTPRGKIFIWESPVLLVFKERGRYSVVKERVCKDCSSPPAADEDSRTEKDAHFRAHQFARL